MARQNSFNPYEVLGISKGASQSEIKQAFARAAGKWHPDRATSESKKKEHEEKIREITHAYEILKDPKKKEMYDKFGTVDPNSMAGANMEDILNGIFGGMGGRGGMGGQSFSFNFGGFDMENGGGGGAFPFGGFHPGSSRQKSAPPAPKPKGQSIKENFEVSIFECFKGVTKTKHFTRLAPNSHSISDSVTVTVYPGVKAGTRYTYPNKGHAGPNQDPGDLILTLKITPNSTYEIDDIDIIHTKHVSLNEALEFRARKYTVTSIDGIRKEILIPEGEIIRSGTEKVFSGLGMPNRKSVAGEKPRGDMRVRFIVDIPNNLSREQREQIIKFLI